MIVGFRKVLVCRGLVLRSDSSAFTINHDSDVEVTEEATSFFNAAFVDNSPDTRDC